MEKVETIDKKVVNMTREIYVDGVHIKTLNCIIDSDNPVRFQKYENTITNENDDTSTSDNLYKENILALRQIEKEFTDEIYTEQDKMIEQFCK